MYSTFPTVADDQTIMVDHKMNILCRIFFQGGKANFSFFGKISAVLKNIFKIFFGVEKWIAKNEDTEVMTQHIFCGQFSFLSNHRAHFYLLPEVRWRSKNQSHKKDEILYLQGLEQDRKTM